MCKGHREHQSHSVMKPEAFRVRSGTRQGCPPLPLIFSVVLEALYSAVLNCYHVRLFATPWTVALLDSLSMAILQVRILEWVAMPSSSRFSKLRD